MSATFTRITSDEQHNLKLASANVNRFRCACGCMKFAVVRFINSPAESDQPLAVICLNCKVSMDTETWRANA